MIKTHRDEYFSTSSSCTCTSTQENRSKASIWRRSYQTGAFLFRFSPRVPAPAPARHSERGRSAPATARQGPSWRHTWAAGRDTSWCRRRRAPSCFWSVGFVCRSFCWGSSLSWPPACRNEPLNKKKIGCIEIYSQIFFNGCF